MTSHLHATTPRPARLAARRKTRIVPVLAAALALLILPAGFSQPASAEPLGFGETFVHADCLHISAVSYRGRQEDFDNHDWVTMRVVNRCGFFVKHLTVELWLLDDQGNRYGRRIWLLGRRELLPPGGKREERYAVPDPDNRIASAWEVKGVKVKRVRVSGRR